jgi:hypothetical protein
MSVLGTEKVKVLKMALRILEVKVDAPFFQDSSVLQLYLVCVGGYGTSCVESLTTG